MERVCPCLESVEDKTVWLTHGDAMMKLSIIIITHNQEAMTLRCLDSLKGIMERGDTEVILVDNGSTDGTCRVVGAKFPCVMIIRNGENRGVAYARNRGLERSCGDYVLILDNDTVANAEAIDGMIGYMEATPGVGICGCRLVGDGGEVQQSYKAFPGLVKKIRNALSRNKSGNAVDPPGEVCFPEYVIGACQLIRRKVAEQVGLLDEAIFYGPEDADYCIRARSKGWETAYLPQFTIVHSWRRASSRNLFSRLSWLHVCGLLHFYVKHRRIV